MSINCYLHLKYLKYDFTTVDEVSRHRDGGHGLLIVHRPELAAAVAQLRVAVIVVQQLRAVRRGAVVGEDVLDCKRLLVTICGDTLTRPSALDYPPTLPLA